MGSHVRIVQELCESPDGRPGLSVLTRFVVSVDVKLLGDSGGVVNSLDFCPASLKSLGCFKFRSVLSSQWKAVTVNLRILHCQH